MTKVYALRKLLEHGPMFRGEIIECTGWKPAQVCRALQQAQDRHLVRKSVRQGHAKRLGYAYVAVAS